MQKNSRDLETEDRFFFSRAHENMVRMCNIMHGGRLKIFFLMKSRIRDSNSAGKVNLLQTCRICLAQVVKASYSERYCLNENIALNSHELILGCISVTRDSRIYLKNHHLLSAT